MSDSAVIQELGVSAGQSVELLVHSMERSVSDNENIELKPASEYHMPDVFTVQV